MHDRSGHLIERRDEIAEDLFVENEPRKRGKAVNFVVQHSRASAAIVAMTRHSNQRQLPSFVVADDDGVGHGRVEEHGEREIRLRFGFGQLLAHGHVRIEPIGLIVHLVEVGQCKTMGKMFILNVQPLEKVMDAVARQTVVVHQTFDGLLVVVVERQHGQVMVEMFEVRMEAWQMDENEIMTFGTALNVVAVEMTFAEEGRHGSRRWSLTHTHARGHARG